jgi:hypothetical protein
MELETIPPTINDIPRNGSITLDLTNVDEAQQTDNVDTELVSKNNENPSQELQPLYPSTAPAIEDKDDKTSGLNAKSPEPPANIHNVTWTEDTTKDTTAPNCFSNSFPFYLKNLSSRKQAAQN